jgi:hypothetical protein
MIISPYFLVRLPAVLGEVLGEVPAVLGEVLERPVPSWLPLGLRLLQVIV